MIDFTPDPILARLGPLPIYWYGICYAVGLFVAYQVLVRQARRRGLDASLIADGLIVIAIAALIGGRAYHVIDQWALYKDDVLTAILPIRHQADGSYAFAGFSGLGVYGGIFTGTLVGALYIRWKRQSVWRWADVVAPALFAMQAIGRWGNFFNQELYGPQTSLPWGIAIQCKNRVQAVGYACPPGSDPNATLGQHFQPLFLYESLSAVVGIVVLLWLSRRFANRLRVGDLLPIFLIWYSVTRFLLEFLRSGYNWTLGGVPTAQIVAGGTIVVALAVLAVRHARPGPSAADVDAQATVEREAEPVTSPDADAQPDADAKPEPEANAEPMSASSDPAPPEPSTSPG
jgi:phosphatidylglycerol:prolipoprotein diacylglycerol transferase